MSVKMRTAASLGCVALVAGIAACSSGSSNAGSAGASSAGTSSAGTSSAGLFNIAGTLALTGPIGPSGVAILAGMRAEVAILNKSGGILGHQISLNIKDDGSVEQQSVAAMRSVLADPGSVDAIFAETSGSLTAADLAVSGPTKILTVTTSIGTPTDTNQDTFGLSPTSDAQSQAVLDAIPVAYKGLTKIGLLNNNSISGAALGAYVQQHAAASGFTIVGTEAVNLDASDFSPQLQKLRADGAQVLIINTTCGSQMGVLGQNLQNLDWKVPVMGSTSVGGCDLSTLVPSSVQPQIKWAGVASATRIGGTLNAQQTAFINEIKATGGSLTSMFASQIGADAVLTIKYAFDKAGSINQAKAVAALGNMASDPASANLGWENYIKQGPRLSASTHNTAAVNPALYFALNEIGQFIDGTYPGTAMG
jgi:ABC-type branched-subunit amino acid transport system substrate-binding protein